MNTCTFIQRGSLPPSNSDMQLISICMCMVPPHQIFIYLDVCLLELGEMSNGDQEVGNAKPREEKSFFQMLLAEGNNIGNVFFPQIIILFL